MPAEQPVYQPLIILPANWRRILGKEALRWNIAAAVQVAETVKSTLGPKGMDKMLVDELGEITITNDGVTILKEMEVAHPAAKIMVEIAKTQEEEVGDGTTSVVVIAGELLKKAEKLLDEGLHPTVIIKGYMLARDYALKVLEEIAEKVPADEQQLRDILLKVARTALYSKVSEVEREYLAKLAVDAVLKVAEKRDGKWYVDKDRIKIEKKVGGGLADSQLIEGIVIDKEKVHPNMPERVENAKIALIAAPLEVKSTEIDMKIQVTSPEDVRRFIEQEKEMLKEMVEKIKSTGANVVFCQKGIDDVAQYYLAKAGILAVRRVKKSDMEKLAQATGAKIVNRIEELTPEDLGTAKLVEERRVGKDKMIFVEGAPGKAVTILLRGGSEKALDEAERALDDAIGVLITILKDGRYVAGGGATEMELAKRIEEYAKNIKGKEQLAVKAFAEALKVIPKTLAENAGMDAIDVLVTLETEHANGNKWAGVDVIEEKVANMLEKGVIEPYGVKAQMLKSAHEAAELILRIDDIIAAEKKEEKGKGGKEETETEEE
ncbi:MAG: thermosome subunit [bacterium]|nr:thermosome subunit [bacterium]